MKPIKLRVPREEAGDLPDDLTAWASTSGIDPGLTIVNGNFQASCRFNE